MKRIKRPFRVLVAIELCDASGRDIFSGVLRFLDSGHRWQFDLLREAADLTPSVVANARANGYDGILMSFPGTEGTLEECRRSPLPMAMIDIADPSVARRRAPTVHVRNDNASIARMAFGHLKERTDFASYAFFPAPKRCRWSDERERGFVAAVSRNGGHVYVFSSPSAAGSERRRRDAAEWLASLPKPCAVFAAADMCAVQVLDAAHRSKLDVPGQVAVLGTDNDTNLALYSDPPLSSVLPGHADMGYAAAEALERLMSGRPVRRIVSIPAVGVIDRESTALSSSASVLVRRALDYISLNACTGIGIPDVVRHLGASRRLVERRFREVAGKSIRETIEEFRLAKVEQLLKGTTLTLEQISSDCGFSSAARLSHLYKQRFGQPPVRSCRRLVKSVLVAGAAAVLVIFL